MPITPFHIQALDEFGKRKADALAMFRPYQNQEPIFLDVCQESLITGGNRSGKTISAAVKFAACARDQPVIFQNGQVVHVRREHQRGRPLLMWVFGLDMNHIGKTIHRTLFRSNPALFYIIRDEDTGAWRSYQPWNPNDVKRKGQRKAAPPLIPPSWIVPKSWSWENHAARNFEKVVIHNPHTREVTAEIRAWSSQADEPPAGDPVDIIWIDETIKKPDHYAEYQARLLDNEGFIFWSSWPAAGDAKCANVLEDISKRAKKSREENTDYVSEHVLPTDENPHFTKEQLAKWSSQFSDEEYRVRVKGERQNDKLRMYPSFNKNIHKAIIDGDEEDDLSRILRSRSGEPPSDWTRELILDPGTQHPAMLFCAVPPPEFGCYYVPYREVYGERYDADELAQEAAKIIGGYELYRMIIDNKAGAQKPMGFRLTIKANYEQHFQKHGVTSRYMGSRFISGSSDVAGRILEVIDTLKPAPMCQYPQLRIVTENCPSLVQQMTDYRKEIIGGQVKDFKPAAKQKIDVASCLEYGVSRRPAYVAPSEKTFMSQATKAFNDLRKRMNRFKKPEDKKSFTIGPAR